MPEVNIEEKIIDYMENTLSAEDRKKFEIEMESDPKLKELVLDCAAIRSLESNVTEEEYSPSPGFALRLMEKIEKENVSLVKKILNFLQTPPIWAGAVAVLLIFFVFIKKTPQVKSPGSPKSDVSVFEPFTIESIVAENRSAFSMSEVKNINKILNSSHEIFPAGSGDKVKKSLEILQYADNSIIMRITLSGEFNTDQTAIAGKDINLRLKLNSAVVKSIEFPGTSRPLLYPPASGELILVKGNEILSSQQFTVVVKLNLNSTGSGNIGEVFVSYINPSTKEQQTMHSAINSSEASDFENTSPQFQNLLRLLYPAEKSFQTSEAEQLPPGRRFQGLRDSLSR